MLLPFLVLEVGLWRSGESVPVQEVVKQQQQSNTEFLYGRGALGQQDGIYKKAAIETLGPNILIIGSSRVLQFRDFMFHPLEDQFYNAGRMINNLADLEAYTTKTLSGALPKPQLLILGIDPWWLKSDSETQQQLDDTDAAHDWRARILFLRSTLLRGQFSKLWNLYSLPSEAPYSNAPALGLMSRTTGAGFRPDGSHLGPPKELLEFMDKPVFRDRETPPIAQRIQKSLAPFDLPWLPGKSQYEALLSIVKGIQASGIELIIYLPPFSTESLTLLENSAEHHQLLQFYRTKLVETLSAQGIGIMNMLSPNQIGLDDRYMFDGVHPSEVLNAQILLGFLQDYLPNHPNSVLAAVDQENLQQLINAAALPLAFKLPEKGP